jgi:hypothetical protein
MPRKSRFTLIMMTLLLVTAVFAQFSEPVGQRYYLLGELAGEPIQVDVTMQSAWAAQGEVSGDFFYETTGETVTVTGNIDQQDSVVLQLTRAGEIIGSVTGTLTAQALEGNYTPLDAEAMPINWQVVAVYASLRFQQGRIEATSYVPHFTTRASILNEPWQAQAFEETLQFAREGQRDVPEYDLFGYWLEDTFDIAYYADDFVSVLQVYNVYGGGAHPNVFYGARNVGIGQDAVELTLSDVLSKQGLMVLSDYVLEQLSAQDAQFVVNDAMTYLNEQDMSAFVVSPQGLHIHFAPYAVGPYVQGSFEVVVPWDVLADHMLPETPLVRFL